MEYILQISVLLFSVIIHEVAHGFVAYKRGDDTAKIMGRLTLNL
jgi:Zn-dependent protease